MKETDALERHSPESWDQIFDGLPHCVCVFDVMRDHNGAPVDFRVARANRAAVASCGRMRDSRSGALLSELWDGHGEDDLLAACRRVVEAGGSFRLEGLAARDDATDEDWSSSAPGDSGHGWIHGSAAGEMLVLSWGEASPGGGVARRTMVDVKERSRVESALLDSEERLLLAKAAANLGIHDYDIVHNRIDWDATTRSLWGVAADELVTYETFIEGIHPDDRTSTDEALTRALDPAGDGRFEVEYRVVNRQDGETRWVAATGRTSFESGRAVRLVGTVQDITRRRRAEEARALLAAVVEGSGDAIISKTLDGTILTWNRGAEEVFGYAAEEVVGRPINVIIPEDRQDEERKILERLRRGEQIDQLETVRRRKDGRLIDISVTVSPVQDERGRVLGASKVARDITARKAAEESLMVRARQQRAIAELGEFALRTQELQSVFHEATVLIAKTLDVEYCKVLEALPGDGSLLLRAGVGWRDGLIGTAHVSAGLDSQAGFTLHSDEPVIVDDLQSEMRFHGPSLLIEHGVVSGLSCVIRGADGGAWGVLGAHSRQRISFTRDDVSFLVAAANVLAVSIERDQAEQAFRRSEERLHAAQEAGGVGTFEWNATDDVNSWSPELEGLYGLQPGDFGGTYGAWLELVHPEDRSRAEEDVRKSMVSGELDSEWRVILPTGRVRWLYARAWVQYDSDGQPTRMLGVNVDITERKQHEEQMKTVMAELNHRVKNTLAVIQSIARQTLRRSPDRHVFQESFEERIRSIASAHSLLTSSDWEGASLHDIIASEIEHRVVSPGQVQFDGPEVLLRPRAALALHMVIHELTTNASKYGGLKSEQGRIDIHWDVEEGERRTLRLSWKERVSDAVAAPTESGYGSSLITELIEYELLGRVRRDYQPDGLKCSISFALADSALAPNWDSERARVAKASKGPRVLVVEDRYALAMSLCEELEEAGYSVIGPTGSLEHAMELAERESPSTAVLDVDLDGTKVYPLARALRRQGLPFVLLTGFDRSDLPEDLRDVPILHKPVAADDVPEFLKRHC